MYLLVLTGSDCARGPRTFASVKKSNTLRQTPKGEYGKVSRRDSEVSLYNEEIHEGFGRIYKL